MAGKKKRNKKVVRNHNFIGQRFGRLTVIAHNGIDKWNNKRWLCKCDCGGICYPATNSLTSGKTQSCGCRQKELNKNWGYKPLNLQGQRFGRLVAVEMCDERDTDGSILWKCKCDCGGRKTVPASRLKKGNTRSCGCLARENARRVGFNLSNPPNKSQKTLSEKGLDLMYGHYKSHSKKRGLKFELKKSEFNDITLQNCVYCGKPPSKPIRHKGEIATLRSGIDRKDSSLGYTLDNSAPCCTNCNFAKSQLTIEEFKEHITRIYNHFIVSVEGEKLK